VFEHCTQASIKVLMLAQEEAKVLGHDYVAVEHIFLGLIGEGEGIAAQELKKAGTTLRQARTVVEEMLGRGDYIEQKSSWWQTIFGPSNEPSFDVNAKKLLELAWSEIHSLNVNYLGTEHLLLGLLRLDEEQALELLKRCKLNSANLRESVVSTIRTGSRRKQ
jgi:ATP-dependent Clp protease ATP-binding subunit ClpC